MQSAYLEEALNPTKAKEIIKELVELLTPWLDKFDAIAFRGSSGLLIGPALAMALDKGMILVRKEDPYTDAHHSWYKVEGDTSARSYIVVDDQVCTGETINKIQAEIREHFDKPPVYVGTVLYHRVVRTYQWASL
jgi:adenine/guanine phosphoribosyltransferase-like PRPP-binding protein